MAAFANTYNYLSIASTDFSTYTKSVELTVNGEVVDVTAMSSTAWRSFVAGLKDWTITATMNTDVANGLADSVLWPLYSTSVSIEVRATGSAVSTSNPKWTGSAILQPGKIFGGSVGSGSETTITLRGTGVLTRATS